MGARRGNARSLVALLSRSNETDLSGLHGLALYYVLAVTQLAHLGEHVAQMYQLHVLGLAGRHAHGIFGALDIEWVHFAWNAWVAIAAVLLLARFPQDRWLWLVLALAVWHGIEHAYIMSVYLSSGVAGTPGLIARGGVIGGGLPLARPDLHFLYNLVETVPLVIGFASQLRRSHDRLAGPLPHAGGPDSSS